VTASQPGSANIGAAAAVVRTFAIAKASQTISFGALADRTFGDPDFTVTATASSGLAVPLAAGGSCTVAGAIVHLTGAGSCTITASQAGNANYDAAAPVARAFSIATRPLTPPPGCKVPKLVGKSLAAAKRALKQKHCRVGKVSHAYSRKHKKGTVSSQSRRAGKVLARNAKVDVVVSRGRRQ
jgi:chitinase